MESQKVQYFKPARHLGSHIALYSKPTRHMESQNVSYIRPTKHFWTHIVLCSKLTIHMESHIVLFNTTARCVGSCNVLYSEVARLKTYCIM